MFRRYQCILDYKKHMPSPKITAVLCVGGVDMRDQIRALKDGVHIVVGTPGRVEDLMKGGKLSVSKASLGFFSISLFQAGHAN